MIHSIQEWKQIAPDATILIATSEEHHAEIIEVCQAAGFCDVIPAWRELFDTSNKYTQGKVYQYFQEELSDWTGDIAGNFRHASSKTQPEVIVSLTSYPKRINTVWQVVETLMWQTVLPDRIILWLADSQFPNREKDLPGKLTALCSPLFEIRWTKDIKSYKKLIPALREFPEDIIITADDDILYDPHMLERLLAGYKEKPNCIQCHRITTIDYFSLDKIEVVREAKKVYPVPTYLHTPVGCGGCLYPPHSLHQDALREDLFAKLVPTNDDLWFWAMGVLNGCKVNLIKDNIAMPNMTPESKENALYLINNSGPSLYFIHLRNILSYYPILQDLLSYEQELITQRYTAIVPPDNDWKGSSQYWERRYSSGGNSGSGSYGRLAKFKADVLNSFVADNSIELVLEWGCGDGNQLALARYPKYVGYDVSKQAVAICKEKFKKDESKAFMWSGADDFVSEIKADLSMSLDVIYHLVEDDVYEAYMDMLFESSRKYVCIYSSNFEKVHTAHVRCRKFTDYVERKYFPKGWKLVKYIPNQYPYEEDTPTATSWSDFYFYEKEYFQ